MRLKSLFAGAALAFVATVALAGSGSNYIQNKYWIDGFFRGQSYSVPTTLYIALATTAGSQAACGTEVSGGSYARVAVTSSLANWAGTQGATSTTASTGTTGTTSNNAVITFPSPTASWGTVTNVCIYDASTSGNLLFNFALTSSQTINSGASAPSFAISALTVTIN